MKYGLTILLTDYSISPAEQVTPYRDAGADRIVFALPPEKGEKLLPLLDRYAELARSIG